MAHSLPEIEKDALRLSAEDRARLAVRLLEGIPAKEVFAELRTKRS